MVNWLIYSYEDKLYNKQINHHYLEKPIIYIYIYILIEITNIPITFNFLHTNPLLPKKEKSYKLKSIKELRRRFRFILLLLRFFSNGSGCIYQFLQNPKNFSLKFSFFFIF